MSGEQKNKPQSRAQVGGGCDANPTNLTGGAMYYLFETTANKQDRCESVSTSVQREEHTKPVTEMASKDKMRVRSDTG